MDQEKKKQQLRIKKDMTHILEDMPEVWHMIVSTRCCPTQLGLQKYCPWGIDNEDGQTCEDCWKQAIQIANPVLIIDGMYYCPECKKPLSVVKIENGQQQWRCKDCHKTYVVPTAASEPTEKKQEVKETNE